MKNKIIYALFSLLMMLVIPSCLYEDLGNYSYKEINEVVIKGLDTEKYLEKMAFEDHYDLHPTVEYSQNQNESDYEYRWEAFLRNALSTDIKKYEIGTEKNLTSLVELRSGEYVCYYYVKDKKTAIEWSAKFYLKISSAKAPEFGWCMLCDVQGQGSIDVVVPRQEGTALTGGHSLLKNLVPNMELIGTPRRIFAESSLYNNLHLFYVMGDKGTYKILNQSFVIADTTDMRLDFGLFPDNVIIHGTEQMRTLSDENIIRVAVDEKGDYYTMEHDDEGSYGLPQNSNPTYTADNGESKNFVTAPWIGARMSAFPMFDTGEQRASDFNMILYDQTYKRFMRIPIGKTKSEVMKFSNDGALWSGATTGLRMMYGENIYVPNDGTKQMFLSLLTDEKDVWLYGIAPMKNKENKQTIYAKISAGAELLGANSFAFSSDSPRFYFSKGSKIYVIDYSAAGNKKAVEVMNLPGEEIVKISFWLRLGNSSEKNDPYYQTKKWLSVATNKVAGGEDCGVLRSFEIPLLVDGQFVKKIEAEGISKIIDFAFKEKMTTTY